MSDHEIARALSSLDTIAAPKSTVTMGPFAIFHSQDNLQIDGPGRHVQDDSQSSDDYQHVQSTVDSLGGDDTTWNIPGSGYQNARDEIHTDIEESCESLMRNLETDAQLPGFGLSPSWNSSLYPCDEAASSPSLGLQSPLPPSPHLGLSMPVFQDPQTSVLMSHYMNHVADLLQPVFHPGNPWRTTYFPFALEGCPELFLSQSSSPTSYVSIALFNSLLSSAAFHLRNVTGGSTALHKLGLQHRTKSLQALNAALVHPSDSQLYTVYLTAMLSLVTIDVSIPGLRSQSLTDQTMTGEDTDFPIHLKACRQLQKPPSVVGDSNQQVNSICRFLTLLARTTSIDLRPKAWGIDGSPLFDQTPHFRSDERSIEYIYGITPTLGNLLEKTCQIAEFLAVYKDQDIPAALLDSVETLGDELSTWSIETEPFSSIGPEQSPMLEIARCQARAFHSAVLIFYFRTIESSPIDLEGEVRTVWQNLTDAENLKDEFMGGEKRAAPMSWPAFIAACEATDRQAWAEWWARVQEYRVGNFARQWRVVQELWNIMDTDKSVTSWRDALSRSGELVLPI